MESDFNWKDVIIWTLLVLGIIMFIASFFKGG